MTLAQENYEGTMTPTFIIVFGTTLDSSYTYLSFKKFGKYEYLYKSVYIYSLLDILKGHIKLFINIRIRESIYVYEEGFAGSKISFWPFLSKQQKKRPH